LAFSTVTSHTAISSMKTTTVHDMSSSMVITSTTGSRTVRVRQPAGTEADRDL
jgi:hypothetical protein